ncbi:MAG: pirin family protein [Rhizobacter sp.]|nr:pirin family protein [Rhizobacter sp.]
MVRSLGDASLIVVDADGTAMCTTHRASPTRPAPQRLERPRDVEQVVCGRATVDGAGVRLTRLLAEPLQRRLDPFLMLDAFNTDSVGEGTGGFPEHPHRGFETVTYMLEGRMRHRDSAGNASLLEPGGVQWMTAGRGLLHSEIPEPQAGRMQGFQLWVNLGAKDKMVAPEYRELPARAIPEVTFSCGSRVRVIAGECHGVAGAVTRPLTEPIYLDITLRPGAVFEQPLPANFNAFVVVFKEAVEIGASTLVPDTSLAVLANDKEADGVRITAPATLGDAARVLLIAGQPLNEPIVQYGPFVMNTDDQIHEALADFQRGKF